MPNNDWLKRGGHKLRSTEPALKIREADATAISRTLANAVDAKTRPASPASLLDSAMLTRQTGAPFPMPPKDSAAFVFGDKRNAMLKDASGSDYAVDPATLTAGRPSLGVKPPDGKYLLTVNLDKSHEGTRFIATDEMIDTTKESNFATLSHEELVRIVGHEVICGPSGKPILSEEDTRVVGAAVAIKHTIQSNPNLTDKEKRRILDEMRGMAKKGRRESREEMKRLGAEIDTNQAKRGLLVAQSEMLHELGDWLIAPGGGPRPLLLQRPDGSQLHKFQEAAAAGEAVIVLAREGSVMGSVLSGDLARTLEGTQSFVVEHNWAAVMNGAEISGSEDGGAGEVDLPYSSSCFEFVISGKRVLAIFYQDPDSAMPTRMAINARFKAGWGILMSYTISDAWKAAPAKTEVDAQALLQPLADLLTDNIRAVAIMLEAKVVEREVIRVAAKLNAARAKRGKLPLFDYHVISLARRSRVAPRPLEALDPDRERIRKRMHFVRSHWRQYAGHRTKIPWHLRGDPDLGFVDKHYKL